MHAWLRGLSGLKMLQTSALRRAAINQIKEANPLEFGELKKADGRSVQSMYSQNPDLFTAGATQLPTGKLDPKGFDDAHLRFCPRCKYGAPDPSCPYPALRACIAQGWEPPLLNPEAKPATFIRNHPSFGDYSGQTGPVWDKWVSSGIVKLTSDEEQRRKCGREPYISPLGAVVKNSDRARARALVDLSINNSAELARANEKLDAEGIRLKFKARIIADMRNANQLCARRPFSTPKLDDVLSMVEPGCWIGVVDVEEYFPSFPLSPAMSFLFCVSVAGALYYFARCNFGFAMCPYFCDTYSALLLEWVKGRIGSAFVMCDDWVVTGPTEAACDAKLDIVEDTGGCCGFTFAGDKRRNKQEQVVLGVRINSNRMALSFDPVQAKAMQLQVDALRADLARDKYSMPEGERRSMTGQLNWFAQVFQSGKTRLHAMWLFAQHGHKLGAWAKPELRDDLAWWSDKLGSWAEGGLSGYESPILNAQVLCADGGAKVMVLQSDASGDDGFGYHVGSLADQRQRYYAQVWDDQYNFNTSHHGELEALRHYCRSGMTPGTLLVWVTDCQSAAWSINKGRCKERGSQHSLREIMELCDQVHVLLVALWVPRELNLLADHLSHLARSLSTHSASGHVQDL